MDDTADTERMAGLGDVVSADREVRVEAPLPAYVSNTASAFGAWPERRFTTERLQWEEERDTWRETPRSWRLMP